MMKLDYSAEARGTITFSDPIKAGSVFLDEDYKASFYTFEDLEEAAKDMLSSFFICRDGASYVITGDGFPDFHWVEGNKWESDEYFTEEAGKITIEVECNVWESMFLNNAFE